MQAKSQLFLSSRSMHMKTANSDANATDGNKMELGLLHTWSVVLMSDENLFMMRPMGVVSKNLPRRLIGTS